jgi:tetratricopeptide (TPR) repeat protein
MFASLLVAQRLGEYAKAEAAYQEALAIRRRLDDAWGAIVSLITLADLYCDIGRLDEAAADLRDSDTVCQETGGPWGRAYWLMVRGNLAQNQSERRASI